MNSYLSVILPVHNAEVELAGQVTELLDVLADIAPRFELLILDDGSTDHTEEVAHELCRSYPQLRVLHHDQPQGPEMALRTGMAQTRGDVVMLCDTHGPVSALDIRRLWDMRHAKGLIEARTEPRRQAGDLHTFTRIDAPGETLRTNFRAAAAGGIQMILRPAAQQLEA